ncbi:uncharacterized protein [Bos taurus]|uniref:uncharacterized protein isoform X1 n=1 Tax=Bos taurus TaxID=9913 RepID=UPI0028CB85FD|nr:uncharacterized protein LOC100335608 isoform X1 [Bos taurus]
MRTRGRGLPAMGDTKGARWAGARAVPPHGGVRAIPPRAGGAGRTTSVGWGGALWPLGNQAGTRPSRPRLNPESYLSCGNRCEPLGEPPPPPPDLGPGEAPEHALSSARGGDQAALQKRSWGRRRQVESRRLPCSAWRRS